MTHITKIRPPKRISTRAWDDATLDAALDPLLAGTDVEIAGRIIRAKDFDANAILIRELRSLLLRAEGVAPARFAR
jgi:hypothetical protein